MKTIYLPFVCLLTLASCSKEIIFEEPQFPGVDRELWEYYTEFEKQASLRGLNIDLNFESVTGEIGNIPRHGVLGVCEYGSIANNHITIDRAFWKTASKLYREFVVFHELGHCVLLRDHDESMNGQGICLSIMRSGTGSCRDRYNEQNRGYYLDELFFKN